MPGEGGRGAVDNTPADLRLKSSFSVSSLINSVLAGPGSLQKTDWLRVSEFPINSGLIPSLMFSLITPTSDSYCRRPENGIPGHIRVSLEWRRMTSSRAEPLEELSPARGTQRRPAQAPFSFAPAALGCSSPLPAPSRGKLTPYTGCSTCAENKQGASVCRVRVGAAWRPQRKPAASSRVMPVLVWEPNHTHSCLSQAVLTATPAAPQPPRHSSSRQPFFPARVPRGEMLPLPHPCPLRRVP